MRESTLKTASLIKRFLQKNCLRLLLNDRKSFFILSKLNESYWLLLIFFILLKYKKYSYFIQMGLTIDHFSKIQI